MTNKKPIIHHLILLKAIYCINMNYMQKAFYSSKWKRTIILLHKLPSLQPVRLFIRAKHPGFWYALYCVLHQWNCRKQFSLFLDCCLFFWLNSVLKLIRDWDYPLLSTWSPVFYFVSFSDKESSFSGLLFRAHNLDSLVRSIWYNRNF